MKTARLSLLANRHAQVRKVIARDVSASGTQLTLECGHFIRIAPHFDATTKTECLCSRCGETFVKSSPLYAKEFEA